MFCLHNKDESVIFQMLVYNNLCKIIVESAWHQKLRQQQARLLKSVKRSEMGILGLRNAVTVKSEEFITFDDMG